MGHLLYVSLGNKFYKRLSLHAQLVLLIIRSDCELELPPLLSEECIFGCSLIILVVEIQISQQMLAKLASGMNKPAQQTVVPFSSVKGLLESLPIKKM